jgi:hypothetical protein
MPEMANMKALSVDENRAGSSVSVAKSTSSQTPFRDAMMKNMGKTKEIDGARPGRQCQN